MAQALCVRKKRKGSELVAIGKRRNLTGVVQPKLAGETTDDMLGSAARPATTVQSCENEPEMQRWSFQPAYLEHHPSQFELTHTRKMPLPFAIDLKVGDNTWECLYVGHGQSKVVYRFADVRLAKRVLKLTPEKDREPHIFSSLSEKVSAAQPDEKICPEVYDIAWCQEFNAKGKYIQDWYGWTAEATIPLDKCMMQLKIAGKDEMRLLCLKTALYKQVLAGVHGLLLSDNNLFNFGVVKKTVVIIDAGSREFESQAIAKSTMNKRAIRGWWDKLLLQCMLEEVKQLRELWNHEHSLPEEATFLKANLSASGSIEDVDDISVAQPVSTMIQAPQSLRTLEHAGDGTITQAPDVWKLLEQAHEDEQALEFGDLHKKRDDLLKRKKSKHEA